MSKTPHIVLESSLICYCRLACYFVWITPCSINLIRDGCPISSTRGQLVTMGSTVSIVIYSVCPLIVWLANINSCPEQSQKPLLNVRCNLSFKTILTPRGVLHDPHQSSGHRSFFSLNQERYKDTSMLLPYPAI